jgi:hypothetical protein
MQTLRLALTLREGSLVNVLVGFAAANIQKLRQASQPVPQPLSFRALIDTGAEVTTLDSTVITPLAALGLQPSKIVLSNMPAGGGLSPVYEYTVGLSLMHPSGNPRHNLSIRTLPVCERTLGPLGYRVLIGRDVLSRCLLVYDGPSQSVTLAY